MVVLRAFVMPRSRNIAVMAINPTVNALVSRLLKLTIQYLVYVLSRPFFLITYSELAVF